MTTTTDLPNCRYRGPALQPERFVCTHPGLVVVGPVDAEACRRCHAGGVYCDQPPRPRPPDPLTFPCVHRGAKVRDDQSNLCCGESGKPFEVLACAVHGECSVDVRHTRITDCVHCEEYRPRESRKVILQDELCPGDIAVLTAAVRELHRQYPGEFATDVRTPHPELWQHNPEITPIADDAGELIPVHYDADARFPGRTVYATINRSSERPVHMLEAYCEGLAAALGLPGLQPRHWLEPSICLSTEEKGWISQVQEITGKPGPFWLVNAGIKSDFTAKLWPFYDDVVRRTRDAVTWVQVGAAGDEHPRLHDAIDLVGQTDVRQLVRLVYHSSGVLSGVTALMHLAHWVERPAWVPFRRPAVILAGGRESPHWFTYPGHQVLHTIGELDCCAAGGCWKSRVQALPDDSEHNSSLCEHPADGVGRCMRSIDPDLVEQTILRIVRGVR